MRLKILEVLSRDEIELIHSNSLELLESIGVKVESEEARDLLRNNGCTLEDNDFVKFPEALIKEKLKLVPESFALWGSDGSFNFEIDTTTTKFGTVGTPVKIYDPLQKKGIRKSILEDTIKQIRIVDSLKNIMCSHVDVWPNDVPYLELHYHAIRAWAQNSYKPYGLGCYGRVASQDMMNLASIIVGGEEELLRKPRLIGFFNNSDHIERR